MYFLYHGFSCRQIWLIQFVCLDFFFHFPFSSVWGFLVKVVNLTFSSVEKLKMETSCGSRREGHFFFFLFFWNFTSSQFLYPIRMTLTILNLSWCIWIVSGIFQCNKLLGCGICESLIMKYEYLIVFVNYPEIVLGNFLIMIIQCTMMRNLP